MKKRLVILASMMAVFSLSLSAQTTTEEVSSNEPIKSKRGFVIVPEKGDKALGIDANPFLGYIGNLFVSDSYNNPPSFGFTAQKPGLIYFKYMVTESIAYRVAARIGLSTSSEKVNAGMGDDRENEFSTSAAALGLFGGYEISPVMKSRLRAFYGPAAQIGYTPFSGFSSSDPTRFVTGKLKYTDGVTSDNSYTEKGGNTINIGAGGFVGLEFFILPKISLSGEFNVMLNYSMTGERTFVPDAGDDVVIESKSSGIDLDNIASGSIVLMCYF